MTATRQKTWLLVAHTGAAGTLERAMVGKYDTSEIMISKAHTVLGPIYPQSEGNIVVTRRGLFMWRKSAS